MRAPTSNSLSLHIMLDRTYPGCLPCRRPEKRAEAPLGDDRVVRYHDSPDGVDEDAEVVDDDVEMVGS